MAKQVEVEIEQIGASVSRGKTRNHEVLIDRPVAKGGEDRGPLGGEYLLFAVGGCFMSNFLAAIRAREADISEVHIVVSGVIDEVPERFTSVTLRISARHNDSNLVRKLAAIAERACVVSNTLKGSISVSMLFEDSAV